MSFGVVLPLPLDGQYQTQWDYILSNFAPDALYVIGDEADAPDTNVFSRLNANYIETCDEIDWVNTAFVLMAPDNGRYIQGDESLATFTHPDNAIYFFGHDTRWVDGTAFGNCTPDHKVYVPTDTDDDMWSWETYGVVAWDRRMKHG